MKKLLLVLLAVLLAFAMIACDGDADETKDSTNENSTSSTTKDDNTDATVPGDNTGDNTEDSTGDNKNEDDTDGSILANALIKKLEETASMQIDFSFDLITRDTYWSMNESEELEEIKDLFHGIAKFQVVISKTENGFNLKMVAQVTQDNGDGFAPARVLTPLYIVDGVIYEYDSYYDAYVATEIPEMDTTEIEAIIGEIIGSAGLTEEDISAMLGELGDAFIYAFNIVENKGTISADIKPVFDALTEYLAGIDPTTYKVKDILNDILALVDETLTADVLVETVAATLDMTVGEYFEMLDAALQAEYEMTLNEVIAAITNDETVQLVLAEIMLAGGVSEEEIATNLEMIKSLTIEAIIPEEMLSVKIYDLLMAMTATEEEPSEGEEPVEIPTLEEMVMMVNMILDMTLAEVEENFEIPVSQILAVGELVELRAFNFKLDVNFRGVFELVSVEGEFEFDATAKNPSYYDETLYDSERLTIKITFKIYGFSKETVEITLPEDIEIVIPEDEYPEDDYEEDVYTLFAEDGTHLGVVYLYVDEWYAYATAYVYGVEYIAIVDVEYFDGINLVIDGNSFRNGDDEPIYEGEVVIAFGDESKDAVIFFGEHLWGAWEDGEDGWYYRQCANCGAWDEIEAE